LIAKDLLELDQRARQPGFGAIEEEPQAESLGALNGHKAHLTANMIDVIQPVQLRFVVIGVALQSRDAFLNGLTEPRTDLESILGNALNGHEEHLGAGMTEAEVFFAGGLKFPLLLPILPKHPSLRQITASRNFGNVLSENSTVFSDRLSVIKPQSLALDSSPTLQRRRVLSTERTDP
jgi:hypothetical protein